MLSGVLAFTDLTTSIAALRPRPSLEAGDQPAEQDRREPRQAAQSAERPAEGPDGLTEKERLIVAELQRTDREVRAHEQAHLAAAGALARGVSYTYETGPDGQRYAVAGEVSIDTAPVAGDPEATIRKAQQIRAAANAPAEPSSQDRAVAAQASQLEQKARAELNEQRQKESEERAQRTVAEQYDPAEASSATLLDVIV